MHFTPGPAYRNTSHYYTCTSQNHTCCFTLGLAPLNSLSACWELFSTDESLLIVGFKSAVLSWCSASMSFIPSTFLLSSEGEMLPSSGSERNNGIIWKKNSINIYQLYQLPNLVKWKTEPKPAVQSELNIMWKWLTSCQWQLTMRRQWCFYKNKWNLWENSKS